MFREALRDAARAGCLLGVKYGIAAALVLAAISWMLGDYVIVRERALNGQRAFEYLQRSIASASPQQQK